MLNIEKYKNKIIDEFNEGRLLDCIFYELRGGEECVENSCANCTLKSLDWLVQEYKEPILTDKEKGYLKNVIEPRRNDVTIVTKSLVGKPNEYFTVNVYNKNSYNNGYEGRLLEFIVTEDMPFNGMEQFKHYTLEELGL